jgi:hypothetical protein
MGAPQFLDGSGCDDALIGIGKTGMISLDFIREADDALEAIVSAVEDVKRVIPDAQLVEATPNRVGLANIADLVGLSRQSIRKLKVSNHSFPARFHEGKCPIWQLEYENSLIINQRPDYQPLFDPLPL